MCYSGNTVLARTAPGAPGVLAVGARGERARLWAWGLASLAPELPPLLACVRTLAEVGAGVGRGGEGRSGGCPCLVEPGTSAPCLASGS